MGDVNDIWNGFDILPALINGIFGHEDKSWSDHVDFFKCQFRAHLKIE